MVGPGTWVILLPMPETAPPRPETKGRGTISTVWTMGCGGVVPPKEIRMLLPVRARGEFLPTLFFLVLLAGLIVTLTQDYKNQFNMYTWESHNMMPRS